MVKSKKSDMFGSIDDALDGIEKALVKNYGEGSAARLTHNDVLSKVDKWVSTGSIVVDKVIAGGRPMPCSIMPFGRQIEISGPPGAGKTSLCAQIAAEVQSIGGIVVAVDTEERIDEPYWRALGVDTERILNVHASSIEDVFEKQLTVIDMLAEKSPDTPVLMLWDSLGSTFSDNVETPKKGQTFMEAAEKNMGRDAKVIAAGMKMINKAIAKADVMYVYTNHTYDKIGVMFGPKTETPGGRRPKFFATIRLSLLPSRAIKVEDDLGNTKIVGKEVYVEAVKNSMAPALMRKKAVIVGGMGFSNEHTVFDIAKKSVFERKGPWYSWITSQGEVVKFQGEKGFFDKVVTHEEYPDLKAQVLEVL